MKIITQNMSNDATELINNFWSVYPIRENGTS